MNFTYHSVLPVKVTAAKNRMNTTGDSIKLLGILSLNLNLALMNKILWYSLLPAFKSANIYSVTLQLSVFLMQMPSPAFTIIIPPQSHDHTLFYPFILMLYRCTPMSVHLLYTVVLQLFPTKETCGERL